MPNRSKTQNMKSEISSSFSGVGLKAGLLAGAIGAAILTIQYYAQQLEDSRKTQTQALKDADAVDKQFTDKMKRGEVSADDIKKYGKKI